MVKRNPLVVNGIVISDPRKSQHLTDFIQSFKILHVDIIVNNFRVKLLIKTNIDLS